MPFLVVLLLTTVGLGGADRPKNILALVDELTGASDPSGPSRSCAVTVLDSIEVTMGAKIRSGIEGQVPIFEAALQPLFASLPNLPNQGRLSQHLAQYALHRVFVDERGWFVKRLQESDVYNASASSPASLVGVLQNQVPASVQENFQKCFQHGVRSKELAVLAATLDSLVHQEVLERAVAVFQANKIPMLGRIDIEKMEKVLEQVMISYILEEGGSSTDFEMYASGKLNMTEKYPSWPELQRFLLNLEGVLTPAKATHLSFDDLTEIIHELRLHFGRWQDGECHELSRELQQLQDECPGHVDLRDFYASNLKGKWQFSESPAYLRALGALEESQPGSPRVIASNYVQGPSNCVTASRYYSQCCLNGCSRHLSSLEKAIAAPEATPELLRATIEALLPKPQVPVSNLWDRLHQIAVNGKVALHGPFFAEWLHRAYPWDCSAPSTLQLEKPAEYMARTGEISDLSLEEMASFVEQTQAHGSGTSGTCELPWQPLSEEAAEEASAAVSARFLLATPGDVLGAPWMSLAAVAVSGGVVSLCLIIAKGSQVSQNDFLVADIVS